MKVLLAVALGSGIGGTARVALGLWLAPRVGSDFPWAVLAVNVIGSLAIGVGAALTEPTGRFGVGHASRQFLLAGVCGGFTTFSFFSLQTLHLIESGRLGAAGGYVGLTLVLGMAAVWLGHAVGERWERAAGP